MSLVMRQKYDDSKDVRSFKKILTPRTLLRKYKLLRSTDRSKSFWMSYNNFILCNRLIELRITKLFSFQNTQYIVVCQNNFKNNNMGRSSPKLKKIHRERCYMVEFTTFNIDACIFEICFIEHIVDLKIMMEHEVNFIDITLGNNLDISHVTENSESHTRLESFPATKNTGISWKALNKIVESKADTLQDRLLNMNTNDCVHQFRFCNIEFSSKSRKSIAIKISSIVLSLWIVYLSLSLRNYSCTDVISL